MCSVASHPIQGLSQDLETGFLKLAIVKFLFILFFLLILKFQS